MKILVYILLSIWFFTGVFAIASQFYSITQGQEGSLMVVFGAIVYMIIPGSVLFEKF